MKRSENFGRTYISFDWAMKRLLKQKSNYVILEGFLSELLRQDISVSEILDSESIAETENDKTNRVDLLCKNSHDEHIIVEIQHHHQIDYFQRILFGTSKLVLEYLAKGSPYGDIKKVYSIHILYFDLGQGEDYVYHGLLNFKGIHRQDILRLSKSQQAKYKREFAGELYPEYFLLKINNFDEVSKDSLDEWIYYFKTSELPREFKAKGLNEVAKQLNIDAMQPEVKAKYMEHLRELNISESTLESTWLEGKHEGLAEGMEQGIEKGLEQGIEKGLEQGSRRQLEATIIKLFKYGMDQHIIAQIQEIDVMEVEQVLRKEGLV